MHHLKTFPPFAKAGFNSREDFQNVIEPSQKLLAIGWTFSDVICALIAPKLKSCSIMLKALDEFRRISEVLENEWEGDVYF